MVKKVTMSSKNEFKIYKYLNKLSLSVLIMIKVITRILIIFFNNYDSI
jgi:hypothetical protein